MDKTALLELFIDSIAEVNDMGVPIVVKTTLEETSDFWLAIVDAFNFNALEGTPLEAESGSCLVDVDDFDVTVRSGTMLLEECIVWFAEVEDFATDGATLLVACDATESENSGLILPEEITYVVPIEVWVAECGEGEVTAMDEIALVLSGVGLEVDDSDIPDVNKTVLEETSDSLYAEVDSFDVTELERILLVVETDSRLENIRNFDATTVNGTTVLTAANSWLTGADGDIDVIAVDGVTLVAASDAWLPDVDEFAVTAVNGGMLVVVNGAWLADDDDFDVSSVDGPTLFVIAGVLFEDLGESKVTEVKRTKIVMALYIWLVKVDEFAINKATLSVAFDVCAAEVENSSFVVVDGITCAVSLKVCVA